MFSSLPFQSDICSMLAFASFLRGQSPARQTKVVDSNLRPLKSGHICLSVPGCANDATSSNPTTQGRVVANVHEQTNCNCGCVVSECGSVHCKTCKYISQGNTFTSNVTKRSYEVLSPSTSMNCVSENIVY